MIIGRNAERVPTEIVDRNQFRLRRLEASEQLGRPAEQRSDFDNRPIELRGPRNSFANADFVKLGYPTPYG